MGEIPEEDYEKLGGGYTVTLAADCPGRHDVEVIAYSRPDTRDVSPATIWMKQLDPGPSNIFKDGPITEAELCGDPKEADSAEDLKKRLCKDNNGDAFGGPECEKAKKAAESEKKAKKDKKAEE